MKRKLSNKELELAEKGLKRNEEEMATISEALTMSKKQKEFLKIKREYEDSVRPFNRRVEDMEIDKVIHGYESDLKVKQEVIKNLKEQMENGVEVKQNDVPKGVG